MLICTLRPCIKTLQSIPPIGLQTLIELGSGPGLRRSETNKNKLLALYFRLPFVRIRTARGTHEWITLVDYLFGRPFEHSWCAKFNVCFFGLIKMFVVSGTRQYRLWLRRNGQKSLNKFAGEDLKSCSRMIYQLKILYYTLN